MDDVLAGIEPPGLAPDEDDEGRPSTGAYVAINEVDDTHRTAFMSADGEADDDALADILCRAALGAAQMRGPGTVRALRRAMLRHSRA